MMKFLQPTLLLVIGCLLVSCKEQTLFTQIKAEDTGITFANRVHETDSLNILTFEYIYNGGGVALGDFNNDSLTDVYFTGNTVANKLYLNKGDFKFEDVTPTAGVSGQGRWSSGVALVDINNDHKLDIYVCATAQKSLKGRTNLLYVNQGNNEKNVPVFREMAAEYGIADTTHTTNAAFFDYDNDGDLDLYLLVNKMNEKNIPNQYHEKIKDGSSPITDKLYRNDGPLTANGGGFVDVSKQAGILIEGYGLGLNICDINRDGWKDIYVTNDYITNDLLYINNQDGTFTDQAAGYFKHTSHSAMGNDVADINNDGLVDVIAVDMMPATNQRKKMMTPANSYISHQNNDLYGYQYQYARNTLQVNQGINPKTQKPVFSELSLLAGIAETDWSWTPMVTDFDNDGLRDIIITNGFPKDITDQDFIAYRSEMSQYMSIPSLLGAIPSVKLQNFAFRNQGNLQFEDVSQRWGIIEPSFSNGAAYADLDNDGDLDYVVNNINDSASVYRNNLIEQKPEASHYLRVRFEGATPNVMGLGTVLTFTPPSGEQGRLEHTPYRGYLSSIEPIAHLGLGTDTEVKELTVTWPSGKVQVLRHVKADQTLTVNERDATIPAIMAKRALPPTLLTDVSDLINSTYKHEETDAIDFNWQKLLPHKLSQYGPALAIADINGDGLDDVFVGGSHLHKGRFLIQQPNGTFNVENQLPGTDGPTKTSEDMGILFFDADGDSDQDLYIVSGSYEFKANDERYQDQLYLNDGKGHFALATNALPKFLKAGSCVKAADYDRDGDLDLFVGGRVRPGEYPKPTSCYILRNDSPPLPPRRVESVAASPTNVLFRDITAQIAPQLTNIGLVCDALWTDFDNDSWPDLMLAGEWMPLTVLKNDHGKKLSVVDAGLSAQKGFWNSIASGDFDNDGDMDYVAGNLGLNNLYRASNEFPASIYAKDFNNDGFYDAIPTVYYKDVDGKRKEFPFNSRDDLAKQFIQTRKRFENYGKFSAATIQEVLTTDELKNALRLQANWFRSSYVENKGNGQLVVHELPMQAQFAPVFGMVIEDFDQDGNLDVLTTGNDYGHEVSIGRQDASNGLLLKGNGKGGFVPVRIDQSGYYTAGDTKALVQLQTAKGKMLTITSQNRDSLRFFESTQNYNAKPLKAIETTAILTLANGKKRRVEIGYGSSFLSQSSRTLWLNKSVKSVQIAK